MNLDNEKIKTWVLEYFKFLLVSIFLHIFFFLSIFFSDKLAISKNLLYSSLLAIILPLITVGTDYKRFKNIFYSRVIFQKKKENLVFEREELKTAKKSLIFSIVTTIVIFGGVIFVVLRFIGSITDFSILIFACFYVGGITAVSNYPKDYTKSISELLEPHLQEPEKEALKLLQLKTIDFIISNTSYVIGMMVIFWILY
jgi:hypothetical protein